MNTFATQKKNKWKLRESNQFFSLAQPPPTRAQSLPIPPTLQILHKLSQTQPYDNYNNQQFYSKSAENEIKDLCENNNDINITTHLHYEFWDLVALFFLF